MVNDEEEEIGRIRPVILYQKEKQYFYTNLKVNIIRNSTTT